MAEEKEITGKQAAMLRARAYNAGLKFDQKILEWIEYDVPGGGSYRRVEGIPQRLFNTILAELEKREA